MTNGKNAKRQRQKEGRNAKREAQLRAAKARRQKRSALLAVLLALGVIALLMTRQNGDDPNPSASPSVAASDVPPADANFATLVTSKGDIKVKFFKDTAPKTVANFVGLATSTKQYTDPLTNAMSTAPYYNGTIFHRVIPGFMIQGGDRLGTGTGGPGYEFEDEVDNDRKFDKPGLLAMANSGADTNGSQFFITVGTPTHLDGKHTIFGEVVEGQSVADEISKVPTQGDKPVEDILLREVRISAE